MMSKLSHADIYKHSFEGHNYIPLIAIDPVEKGKEAIQ